LARRVGAHTARRTRSRGRGGGGAGRGGKGLVTGFKDSTWPDCGGPVPKALGIDQVIDLPVTQARKENRLLDQLRAGGDEVCVTFLLKGSGVRGCSKDPCTRAHVDLAGKRHDDPDLLKRKS